MKQRLSRADFNRIKHYVGVLLEQGKVIVDSDWNEEQETDLGITLLELWALMSDTLTYYQDRIAEEAFLETASKRRGVSRTDLQRILRAAKTVNTISSRTDVAETIAYRRKKGTLPPLEPLAHDITGWTSKRVEADMSPDLRRLVRKIKALEEDHARLKQRYDECEEDERLTLENFLSKILEDLRRAREAGELESAETSEEYRAAERDLIAKLNELIQAYRELVKVLWERE